MATQQVDVGYARVLNQAHLHLHSASTVGGPQVRSPTKCSIIPFLPDPCSAGLLVSKLEYVPSADSPAASLSAAPSHKPEESALDGRDTFTSKKDFSSVTAATDNVAAGKAMH